MAPSTERRKEPVRRVFFASTDEVLRSAWFSPVKQTIASWVSSHPEIEWRPWNTAFPMRQEATLSHLLEQCDECDSAVCILSADDSVQKRGERLFIPATTSSSIPACFSTRLAGRTFSSCGRRRRRGLTDFVGVNTELYELADDQALPDLGSRITAFLSALTLTRDEQPLDTGLFGFLKQKRVELAQLDRALRHPRLEHPVATGSWASGSCVLVRSRCGAGEVLDNDVPGVRVLGGE